MRTLPVFFTLALAPLLGQAPEVRSTAKDRTALSVTIYQNGLAAIRDTRRVSLPAGPSRLAFADLLPSLRPKSVVLLGPGSGLRVLERNYEFNLLSPASLVDASLGLPVRIKGEDGKVDLGGTLASVPLRKRRLGRIPVSPARDAEEEDDDLETDPAAPPPPPGHEPPPLGEGEEDTRPLWRRDLVVLQSRDPKVLVATKDGFIPADPSSLGLRSVPSELHASPTIFQFLDVDSSREPVLTLLYTAEHLEWSCHYEATLNATGEHLNLQAFATVKNRSGAALVNSSLQLIAGEPHIVDDPPPVDEDMEDGIPGGVPGGVLGGVVGGPPIFREEKLSEYPLFTLDRPVTLENQQEKQLALLHAENIPVRTTFLVSSAPQDYWSTRFRAEGPLFQLWPPPNSTSRREWASRRKPITYRMGTIQNLESHHLGRALPKGSITLRYQDPSGAQVVLPGTGNRASEFPQTPPGEDIELMLGPARGIRVDRFGTFRKAVTTNPARGKAGKLHPQRRWTYGVQLRIANDSSEVANMTVREPLPVEWKLLSSTHPGQRSSQRSWDFQVVVHPHQVAILVYTVLTSPEGLDPKEPSPEVDDQEDEPSEST